MFESLWMLLGVSSWWKRLTGSVSAVFDWVGQSPFHLVLAGLLGSLAVNGWQWHSHDAELRREARENADWQKAFTTEQGAFRAEQQMSGQLRNALAGQNASIEAMTQAGAERTTAAREALSAAEAREAGNASLAARIGQEASQPTPPYGADDGCRTPEAVMAARDAL